MKISDDIRKEIVHSAKTGFSKTDGIKNFHKTVQSFYSSRNVIPAVISNEEEKVDQPIEEISYVTA